MKKQKTKSDQRSPSARSSRPTKASSKAASHPPSPVPELTPVSDVTRFRRDTAGRCFRRPALRAPAERGPKRQCPRVSPRARCGASMRPRRPMPSACTRRLGLRALTGTFDSMNSGSRNRWPTSRWTTHGPGLVQPGADGRCRRRYLPLRARRAHGAASDVDNRCANAAFAPRRPRCPQPSRPVRWLHDAPARLRWFQTRHSNWEYRL